MGSNGWSDEQVKALAIDLVAAMGPPLPRPMEIVAVTGELLSQEAMEMARFYDAATFKQRNALDAVLAALRAP
ncbi:MAG: hypothetical protein JSR34_11110 [Proteobacteria bacterium]|nr:hypothetical protein [Pseudomonadota bacterium]